MFDNYGGLIKQSSTGQDLIFFMQASTDVPPLFTGATGLTPTVTISKDGAAFASPAGAVSELAQGYYKVAANATDTATLGALLLKATSAGAVNCYKRWQISVIDPEDAVRIGLTSLPNAAAGANTGLPVVGTQIPNATAAANGGLPTVDASNQIAGIVSAGRIQIWDVLLTAILTAGSVGIKIKNILIGADGAVKITSDAHTSGATVAAVTAGVTVTTNNDKTNYSISSAGLTAIAGAVWNALTSAHVTAGTFGLKVGSLTDPWDVALPGAYASGKAGFILGTNLDATVSSRSSLSSANVTTAVDTALDATSVELTAIPAATASMRNRITWMFEYFKNKRIVVNNTETLYKDDSSTALGTAAVSNDGITFTKGEDELMADTELSDLTQAATLALTDLAYAVINPTGAIASRKTTLDYLLGLLPVSQGIITLETGVPISTSDQISKSIVYFTPFKGNIVRIFDGVRWQMRTFAEISLTLSALTSGKLYDVFAIASGSTIALELGAAWTNDTTRSEALTLQDGIKVKSGALTKLYLGTIRTTATTTTEDSAGGTTTQVGGKRFVWNEYNAVDRHLLVIDTANTWAYATDTLRIANGATAPLNCVEFILGSPTMVSAIVQGNANLITNVSIAAKIGVGVDSSTVVSGLRPAMFSTGNTVIAGTGSYNAILAPGYHFISWLEKGANGTCVFFGDDASDSSQSGLYVVIKC